MNFYLVLVIVIVAIGVAAAILEGLVSLPCRPPRDEVIGRDQQSRQRRGATVTELMARREARRRNGDGLDPFGLDTQDPPRGRVS